MKDPRIQAFLDALSELSREHGLVVVGTRCPDTLSITEAGGVFFPPDGRYHLEINSDCFTWGPTNKNKGKEQ